MGKTEILVKQHEELMKMAGDILKALNPNELQKDGKNVHQTLIKMARLLETHLALEDQFLYPYLLKVKDEKINQLAKQYMEEMGGLAEGFKAYMSLWPDPESIQKSANEFVEKTRSVLDLLAKRIDKENNELYPLYDQL